MLPLTARDKHRVTPAHYEGRADAPVYIVGTPTPIGRARYRHLLITEGLRYWTRPQLLDAARAWLDQVKPENLDALLDTIDAVEGIDRAAEDADRDREASEADRSALTEWDEILRTIGAQSPAVAGMLADNKLFGDASPYLAAGMFLEGWENVAQPFRRGADRMVPADLLAEMPEEDVGAIWQTCIDLMQVSGAQRKNSASPSSPRATPTPSQTADDSSRGEPQTAEAGTSTERMSTAIQS